MKKLLAALILLAMGALCTTSFGYILVYKMTMNLNGADNDTGKITAIPLKGYFIMDPNVPHEANLIIYGRDANTPRTQKVYLEMGLDSLTTDLWDQGDKYRALEVTINNDFFEFTSLTRSGLINFNTGPLTGRQKVPATFAGVACVFGGEILGAGNTIRDISGTGQITFRLWPVATRWANGKNDENEQKTQAQVVADAEIGLTADKYHSLNED